MSVSRTIVPYQGFFDLVGRVITDPDAYITVGPAQFFFASGPGETGLRMEFEVGVPQIAEPVVTS